MLRQVRVVVATVLSVVGLAGLSNTLYIGYGPLPDRAQRQLGFLDGALASGRDADMQGLFPEGEYFTRVLTGLAEARVGQVDSARSRLASIETPESVRIFGGGMVPEHGMFAAGWSLALAVAIAQASGTEPDRTAARERALVVHDALGQASSPFPASYPGQFWPCDSVVAAGALADAVTLLGLPWRDDLAAWRARALAAVDPETGLLPHQVDVNGAAVTGPRGSSQAIIQAFWPSIDGLIGTKSDQWQRFTDHFVTTRLGLAGVLEYPSGATGSADVDSGPLILGVSFSASAVGLAAARANGDRALAGRLVRQVDLVGIPMGLRTTRYLFGMLPVGDAFIAWARTVPEGEPVTVGSGRSVWFLLWTAPWIVLLGCGVAIWPRKRSNTTHPDRVDDPAD